MFKRILLFLVINFFVLITIGILCSLFGVGQFNQQGDIDYVSLSVLSVIVGFSGSFISLLLSKTIAKMTTQARVITSAQNNDEIWLIATVQQLASNAGLEMPEIAVYKGSANAFATGATKNSALVAVSTGLMSSMQKSEIKAVLAHEISHIKNGDMVTMTLLQGVLNTFVFFVARILAHFLHKSEKSNRSSSNFSYFITVRLLEVVLGILASLVAFAFSRHREYRADFGAVQLLGSPDDMIKALTVLSGVKVDPLAGEIKAFGIVDMPSFSELFSTHPPMEQRIKALYDLKGPLKPQKNTKRQTGGVFGSIRVR